MGLFAVFVAVVLLTVDSEFLFAGFPLALGSLLLVFVVYLADNAVCFLRTWRAVRHGAVQPAPHHPPVQ